MSKDKWFKDHDGVPCRIVCLNCGDLEVEQTTLEWVPATGNQQAGYWWVCKKCKGKVTKHR